VIVVHERSIRFDLSNFMTSMRLKLRIRRVFEFIRALKSGDRPRVVDSRRNTRGLLRKGKVATTIAAVEPNRDQFELLRDSKFFDACWYLAVYSDVKIAGVDPIGHYLQFGFSEGRDPSAQFSTAGYLRLHPDVARNGCNPLIHYLLFGRREGRKAVTPDEEQQYQRSKNPNKRSPQYKVQKSHINLLRKSDLYDAVWYRSVYGDVRSRGVDPVQHYLEFGAAELRDPSPRFSTAGYLRLYPDVAENGCNPLVHYLLFGEHEGRNCPTVEDESRKSATGDAIKKHLLWIVNASDLATQRYRVENLLPHLSRAGWISAVKRDYEVCAPDFENASVVILNRIAADERHLALVKDFRSKGGVVIFDIDDLVFDTSRIEQLEAFRSRPHKQSEMIAGFAAFRQTLLASDIVTVSTPALRAEAEAFGRPALVIPNSLSEAALALLTQPSLESKSVVRICYLSGTATHNADFACCSEALSELLADHPEIELHVVGHLTIPESLPASRVFRHDLMSYDAMLRFLSGMDINLAPLQIDIDFNSCKSELKVFEAALFGIPTVASPTASHALAIDHGRTGYLAASKEQWLSALRQLVCDPQVRRRVGMEAQASLVPRFRSGASAEIWENLLNNLDDVLRRPRALQELSRWPTVSVISILYRKSAEVRFFLDGLALQDYAGPIEVILVDDMSPDDSSARVHEWLQWRSYWKQYSADLEVKIVRAKENLGNCGARNLAMEHASGDIIFITDADCVFSHSLVRRHVEALTGSNYDIAIGHRSIETNGNHPVADLQRYEAGPREAASSSRLQDETNVDSFVNCVARNISIRRDFIEQKLSGILFDEAFSYSTRRESGFGWEDVELGCRAFKSGARIRFLSDTFALHVSSPSSAHGTDKASRSLKNFRRLQQKHSDLSQLARNWTHATYKKIETWGRDEVANLANEDARWLNQHFESQPAPPTFLRGDRPLRILTYRWHCPHQYELYRLGHEFTLVTGAGTRMCDDWDWGKRPLPENAYFADAASIDPREFDLAIVHFDENMFHPEICHGWVPLDWGQTFKWFLKLTDIPMVAVCHGTPQFVGQYNIRYIGDDLEKVIEKHRLELVDAMQDITVVCNSYQAQKEWSFKKSRVIWHGFAPSDYPPGPNDSGILVPPLGAMKARPHYNGWFIYEATRRDVRREIKLHSLETPNPAGPVRIGDIDWATEKYHNYVRTLAKFGVYFNPTRRSPMPRTRAESMMAGLISVSHAGHDVELFIKNGVNGFYSDDPAELARQLRFLNRGGTSVNSMRARSLQTARDLFNQDRYLAAWNELISDTLGEAVRAHQISGTRRPS